MQPTIFQYLFSDLELQCNDDKLYHEKRTKLLIHSRYFYSTSSSPLLLRGTPDCSIDTVSELTRCSATINHEWRTYRTL